MSDGDIVWGLCLLVEGRNEVARRKKSDGKLKTWSNKGIEVEDEIICIVLLLVTQPNQ